MRLLQSLLSEYALNGRAELQGRTLQYLMTSSVDRVRLPIGHVNQTESGICGTDGDQSQGFVAVTMASVAQDIPLIVPNGWREVPTCC